MGVTRRKHDFSTGSSAWVSGLGRRAQGEGRYRRKACILADPILKNDDPEYCDIQYSVKFWKVFAIKSKADGNLVYGFILSQEETIKKKGLGKEGLPRFDRKVTAFLASLDTIQNEAGVEFDIVLHDADAMGVNKGLKPLGKNLEIFRQA